MITAEFGNRRHFRKRDCRPDTRLDKIGEPSLLNKAQLACCRPNGSPKLRIKLQHRKERQFFAGDRVGGAVNRDKALDPPQCLAKPCILEINQRSPGNDVQRPLAFGFCHRRIKEDRRIAMTSDGQIAPSRYLHILRNEGQRVAKVAASRQRGSTNGIRPIFKHDVMLRKIMALTLPVIIERPGLVDPDTFHRKPRSVPADNGIGQRSFIAKNQINTRCGHCAIFSLCFVNG